MKNEGGKFRGFPFGLPLDTADGFPREMVDDVPHKAWLLRLLLPALEDRIPVFGYNHLVEASPLSTCSRFGQDGFPSNTQHDVKPREIVIMAVATFEGIVENGHIRLQTNIPLPEQTKVYVVVPEYHAGPLPRLHSPRLVHPEQVADFVKEIVEVTGDA
jgi:hypothetical protein